MTHPTIPEDLLERVASAMHEASRKELGHIPWAIASSEYREFWTQNARAALNAAGDWLRESVTRPEPLTRSTLNASLKGPEEWKP